MPTKREIAEKLASHPKLHNRFRDNDSQVRYWMAAGSKPLLAANLLLADAETPEEFAAARMAILDLPREASGQ